MNGKLLSILSITALTMMTINVEVYLEVQKEIVALHINGHHCTFIHTSTSCSSLL